jgi:hypothetical protein
MRYGYGWFWQQYDHNHAALVPMSTQYETPPLRWRHPQTCPVDRVSGLGCTCKRTSEETKEGSRA